MYADPERDYCDIGHNIAGNKTISLILLPVSMQGQIKERAERDGNVVGDCYKN